MSRCFPPVNWTAVAAQPGDRCGSLTTVKELFLNTRDGGFDEASVPSLEFPELPKVYKSRKTGTILITTDRSRARRYLFVLLSIARRPEEIAG